MRLKSPSSRGSLRIHFSAFDVFWAAVSPLLALYFRDAYVLSLKGAEGAEIAVLYCGLSLACSLIAFLLFRLSEGVSRYFSVHDALNVVKAAVLAGLLSSLVLFTLNRLDGIPRSTPLLQVLILAAGLLAARTVMLLLDDDSQTALPTQSAVEHIIVIGATRLSSLYIRFLRAYSPKHYRFVAVLDHTKKMIGRSICGVPVVAPPQHLEAMIDEFAIHGVNTDRVIIGGDENVVSKELLNEIRHICEKRGIALDYVPNLVGLQHLQTTQNKTQPAWMKAEPTLVEPQQSRIVLPVYWRIKRFIDFFAAAAAIVIFSPLLLISAVLVLLDVGTPVLFWQQRSGLNGRGFLLHKFRTLRLPFDRHGQPVPAERRISSIGFMLRTTHIDELPQLFSVLVGEMSLIGPRPLLPHDQPTNAINRLSVRPGLTGWAQVNGGSLIDPEEKGALDEWYIRHASPWLDLRIVLMTLRFLFTGERRSEQAVREADLAAGNPNRPLHQRSAARPPTNNQTASVRRFDDVTAQSARPQPAVRRSKPLQ